MRQGVRAARNHSLSMKPKQLRLVYPPPKPKYVSRKRGKQLLAEMRITLERRFAKKAQKQA